MDSKVTSLSLAALSGAVVALVGYQLLFHEDEKKNYDNYVIQSSPEKVEEPKTANSTPIKASTSAMTTPVKDYSSNLSLIGSPHPSTSTNEYHSCVYLDYNATTPIFPEVVNAMTPFFTKYFGNPSSSHIYSQVCKENVDIARQHIGNLINVEPSNIIFTSCGSESDNRAIDIAIHHFNKRHHHHHHNGRTSPSPTKADAHSTDTVIPLPHIISSTIEHPAILLYLKTLERSRHIKLTLIKVDSEGFVNTNSLSNALSHDTALVTIMHSNNEVGTIQPIKIIGKIIHSYNLREKTNILFHSDAAQSLGKVRVDARSLGVDLLTIVGHKYGAPKGIAALYVSENIHACPLLVGGGQEYGLRAGTENVPYIVGLGEASRLALLESGDLLLHMLSLKLRLIAGIIHAFEETKYPTDLLRFNGPVRSNDPVAIQQDLIILKLILDASHSPKSTKDSDSDEGTQASSSSNSNASVQLDQLPNTVNISFKNIRSQYLMAIINDKVACSQGSACHSDSDKISIVLAAMHVPPEYGAGTLRLSLGRHSTTDDIDRTVTFIKDAIDTLLGKRVDE